MRILRSVVGGKCFLATDCLDILNIGIQQLALFVQVLDLLLERRLNAAAAQALADKLARLLVGGKLLQIGQVAGGAQTELLQKGVGRAVNDGLTALGVATELAHQTLVNERRDDAVGVDAADALDHLARDGLVVGDHSKGLECRLRQFLRIPAQHIGLDHVMVGGMRKQAPAAGDLAQLKAAIGLLVLNFELGQKRRTLARGDIQRICQRGRAHRIARNQQERLEGALEAVCL